jgi:hypothetical protein
MVLTVPTNTYNALVDAPRRGIVPRDFVTIRALNIATDAIEEIGLWSGVLTVSAPVIRPGDGVEEARTFHGAAGLMQIPPIPMAMKLDVRTLRLIFSNLSPAVLNATLVYNPKGRVVQVHRGLLDPSTMNLVDPAICRFDGYCNRVTIKQAKAGNDGQIILECQSHARELAMGSAEKFSNQFFKRRGAEQPYLNIQYNVVWGEKDMVHEKRSRKDLKWIRG